MSIYCKHCSKEIEKKDDLIVATKFLDLNAFHRSCYWAIAKRKKTISLGKPVNGSRSTATAIIGPIFYLMIYILGMIKSAYMGMLLFVIFFTPTLVRLYSWWKFEKKF